jgi:tetratricopeptide (TPR) repeat protein
LARPNTEEDVAKSVARLGGDLLGIHAGLLLARPGVPQAWPVETKWRALVRTEEGPRSIESVLARLAGRLPLRRDTRVLVRAAREGRLADLIGALEGDGSVADTARLLLALRLADTDPDRAAALLFGRRASGEPATPPRELRRLFDQSQVLVVVAPRVRAKIDFGDGALRLLEAETAVAAGRPDHAVRTLAGIEDPVARLSRLAAMLSAGQYSHVVASTEIGISRDDLGSLTLVARAVALRVLGRLDDARDALDDALRLDTSELAVRYVALEERESVLRMLGREQAADADLVELSELEGSPGGEWWAAVPGSRHRHEPGAAGDWLRAAQSNGVLGPAGTAQALDEARRRLRRRAQWSAGRGTYGGKHHSEYVEEVMQLLATEMVDAAETLLVGLLDAAEEEASSDGSELDPMYFLTLADLYERNARPVEELAVLERFAAACLRDGWPVPREVLERMTARRDGLVGSDTGSVEAVPITGL